MSYWVTSMHSLFQMSNYFINAVINSSERQLALVGTIRTTHLFPQNRVVIQH